uniref:(4-hydroxy)-benzoate coenzyme A ligase n=1 Tax=Anthoceros agrestis TaxID=41834 RepID=A0A6M6A5M0_9EMBR|nr:(4-hydroxy)-benzoate coenzyme A ligase [Anthoceros agrestis]
MASLSEPEHIFRSSLPAAAIPNVTVPEYILLNAIRPEDEHRVAVVDASDERQYTYGQTRILVKNVAAGLRNLLGIRKGDVVFVLLPNTAEYFILVLGIMWAGGVYSGGNPYAHPGEIEKQIQDSEAKVVVTDSTYFEKVKQFAHQLPILLTPVSSAAPTDKSVTPNPEGSTSVQRLLEYDGSEYVPPEPISQDDLCALPYSSGTTGLSKGVKLTHRNLLANTTRTCPIPAVPPTPAQLASVKRYVVLGLLPFFHIYGTTGICCSTMRYQGTLVVLPRYDLRLMLAALIKYEVTFTPLVPPIILQMVKSPIVNEFDLSKLKLEGVMTAAAPLPPDIQKAFEARFPGVELRQAYGLTEYSCITLSHVPLGYPRGNAKKGSVGFLIPGTEMKILDPDTGKSLPANRAGEICVRGESTMNGYFKNEEATAATIDEQGWLHTGDVGYIDDDGDVFIVERAKELIKYKGFQVPPAELEAILVAHPLIADAAVIPIPDDEAGELPAACVVLAPNSHLNEEDVIRYVGAKVASYKKVRHVEFVSSIPKSLSGKTLRRVLKDDILKRLKKTENQLI